MSRGCASQIRQILPVAGGPFASVSRTSPSVPSATSVIQARWRAHGRYQPLAYRNNCNESALHCDVPFAHFRNVLAKFVWTWPRQLQLGLGFPSSKCGSSHCLVCLEQLGHGGRTSISIVGAQNRCAGRVPRSTSSTSSTSTPHRNCSASTCSNYTSSCRLCHCPVVAIHGNASRTRH